MKKVGKHFVISFFLFLIVYFTIGIIKMPAADMKDNIQKGDVLVYRKFLCFPNHNDIVVYKSIYYQKEDSAEDSRYLFVQRVVALPGDTVMIDSSKVFINHKEEQYDDEYQKNYIVQLNDLLEKIPHLDGLIEEKVMISKKNEYAVSLSNALYMKLKQDTNVIGISYELDNPLIYEDNIFPYNEKIKWNKHFFGPLYIPKKDDKIVLTKDNIYIYFPIIQREEKLSEIKNDSLYINGKCVSEYQFKDDYYFILGDNRDNAIDSRYLGPVKRKDIVGIVFFNAH